MKIPADGRYDYLGERELGRVRIEPTDDVVVGSFSTWTVTYTAGIYGADVGGGLKLGFRRMADWGQPQFDDPAAPNYVTVLCTSRSRLSVRFDPRGHIRPFRAVIVVDIVEHPLYPGDEITVVLGDPAGGSPGMRAQSFPETVCEIAVFLDPLSSGHYERVPQVSGSLRVVSGPLERLSLQAPSTAVVGRPFLVQIRGVDRFGNPTAADAAKLTVSADPPLETTLARSDGPVKWLERVKLSRPGTRVLELHENDKVLARSNPILVRPDDDGFNVYWGELQGQTKSTVGAGSVEEYFHYARDLAGIDFCTHQGHDFMLSDEGWKEVKRETRRFNQRGRFVTLLGYEWSGTTGAGGDRNVLYLGDDGPLYRCTSWQLPRESPDSEQSTARIMHRALRRLSAQTGIAAIMIPHVGGRRADIEIHDPEVEPVIEIASCHGIFEWYFREALQRGHRVGAVASSDDCTTRPGLAFPTTPEVAIRGGLTAVIAKELTREAIFEGLSTRRCYATTGERIVLDVRIEGQPMGSTLSTVEAPHVTGIVIGTAPLHVVSLYDGLQEIWRLTPNPPKRDPRRIRVTWTGARGKDRNRATHWDGGLTLSAGSIVAAIPLNMYPPKWGIVQQDMRHVCWRSVTAGNEAGVLLEVDAGDDAVVSFAAGPADFQFVLGEVRRQDVHRDVGGLEQTVHASTMHFCGDSTQIDIDYRHTEAAPGDHVYWLRVLQANDHRAWSSPIYVERI